MGSWSIVAMLFFLALQVSTGLISDDEIANTGPLAALVSGSWVSWATNWHKSWGKLFILMLVLIHLMALLWHHHKKHPPCCLRWCTAISNFQRLHRRLSTVFAIVCSLCCCWPC